METEIEKMFRLDYAFRNDVLFLNLNKKELGQIMMNLEKVNMCKCMINSILLVGANRKSKEEKSLNLR